MKAMRLLQVILVGAFLFGLYVVSLFWPGAMNGPQSMISVDGPVAHQQLTVFWFTVAVSAFLMVVVGSVFLYCIFRFRAKPGQDFDIPEQSHGSTKVEVALIIASCLLLLVIAIPNAKALFYVSDPPSDQEALKVEVIGHQWWWEFKYTDLGVTTANELHIPVGKPVDFQIKSVDVIHSFWVPHLAGKIDAVPGQNNHMWFQADKPGKYNGHCTEYCGDSHANMRFFVMAEKSDDFDKWVRTQKKDGVSPSSVQEVNGQRLFMEGCNSCHTIQGAGAMGKVGPNLTHFASRTTLGAGIYENNEANLKNWIRYPGKMKPGNRMNLDQVNMVLNDKDVDDLVAYLNSLK